MSQLMSPYDRVMRALTGQVPDRVPVFSFATLHGALEVGLSLPHYFRSAEAVAEGQLRLQQKYGCDCVLGFSYGAVEAEAFGTEVLFSDSGPPNAGAPVVADWTSALQLEAPDPANSTPLRMVLRAIELMAERIKGQVPIIGVAIAPLSLPAMLLGMDRWMELLLFGPADVHAHVVETSTEFCVRWARAQLAAGADAVALGDPISSATVSTRQEFQERSLPNLQHTIARIGGPVALLGVGRLEPMIDLVPDTGALAAAVTAEDDLGACKRELRGRAAVIGNLNNIQMTAWTAGEADAAVRHCLAQAGGAGYILAPQWELPLAVTDEVLHATVGAARRWGTYGPAAGGGL
ncbi:MAG: methylcobamide--CoM methyltransferase MtbA [Chloroflexota bacterium]|nr:MAG: methylcobamide--CoM methyltransferase MtbA [Chloroflexota bacterium]